MAIARHPKKPVPNLGHFLASMIPHNLLGIKPRFKLRNKGPRKWRIMLSSFGVSIVQYMHLTELHQLPVCRSVRFALSTPSYSPPFGMHIQERNLESFQQPWLHWDSFIIAWFQHNELGSPAKSIIIWASSLKSRNVHVLFWSEIMS